jgi:hypothetical protein
LGVRRDDGQRGGGWLIAIAPGAFAFLVEGLVLIAARATHSTTPTWIGVYAFGIAVVAAFAAPFAIGLSGPRDGWMWGAISVGVSFFGLGIGFYFWFLAALANCGNYCLS